MAGAASCSSAGAPLSKKSFDVFISFRGEDTRRNFTSHLYAALRRNHIQTYKDDTTLEKGDEVWSALANAINSSYLCIVVFSKDYASSTWCLRELTHILECKKDKQVIPVFYQIDPSHVRKQSGSYEEAFQKHKDNPEIDEETLQKWRVSLQKATNFAGFHSESKEYRDDHQFIESILKDVWEKLVHISSRIDLEDLVGIDNDCANINLMLRKSQIIGLWGMGGIGKTTIARDLFNKYFSQYEGHCFLENVRESSGKLECGLYGLRKKLFSELLKGNNIDVDVESAFVCSRIQYMTVFIVLDDVDTPEQIKYLVREIIGSKSKIIVTTRDRQVLINGKVDNIYEVKGLNFPDSLKLFCLNAFDRDHPQVGFEELSEIIIDYTKGLPLALKLLGSLLHSKCKEAWKSALEKLRKYPHKPIENVLRLSYNGLDEEEKEIFLDIAFFFKRERKEDVENYLNACNFSATIGLEALQDKALITISNRGKVEMHDLIQEMGWERVREKSINDFEKRSRLRDPKEIYDVLKNNKGSDVIEGIILDLSQIEEDLYLSGDVFKKMTKLKFLKFYFPNFLYGNKSKSKICPSGAESFPNSLRYFHWDAYPLKSLPQTLCLGKLVELHIHGSHVESLGVKAQDLADLKRINLTGSKWLKEAPDFSNALNLESINLSYCKSLLGVPMTFCTEKLVHLDMSGSQIEKLWDGVQELVSLKEIKLARCEKLIELPDFSKASKLRVVNLSYCKSLRCIHPSLLSLWSLSKLNLDWCTNLKSLQSEIPLDNLVFLYLSYCFSLKEFSLSSVNMQVLDLSETAIETLPLSIGRCSNLKNLFLNNLHIKSLPSELSNLQSLVRLDISGCRELETSNLHIIFDGLRSLHDLILEGTDVRSLPDCIKHLSSLEYIGISNCRRLQSLPELPPSLKRLVANDCPSLETVITPTTLNSCKTVLNKPFGMSFRNCMKLDDHSLSAIATDAHKRIKLVAKCQCDHCIGFCFPGNKVPSWFTHHTMGSWMTTEVPSRSDLLGFAFCLVLSLEFSSYEEGKFSKSPSIKIECQCYLDNSKIVTRTYTMICPRNRKRVLLPNHVILWHDKTDSEAMMKAIKDSITRPNSHNSKLSFQFSVQVTYYEGNQLLFDAIKGCGVWPIYALECDYPKEEMEVLRLGNKTNKCKDMDHPSKRLKASVLTKGMELEFEASTSEIGVGGSELKEFNFQPLPTDICMQNGRQDLAETSCSLNRGDRCSELDNTIKDDRLLPADAIKDREVWPIHAPECDYPEEEMKVLGLGNKTYKLEDMVLPSKKLKHSYLITGMEFEFEASTSEIRVGGSELKGFNFQQLPTNICMQNGSLDWTESEIYFNHLLDRSNELDKIIQDGRLLSVDDSESQGPINKMVLNLELELRLDHKSKRSDCDLEADEQQLLLTKDCKQPVPLGLKWNLPENPNNYLFTQRNKTRIEDHRMRSVSVDVSISHDSINPAESYLELKIGSSNKLKRRDHDERNSLLSIAEEILAEFLSKATGSTAIEWVQMPGMKSGPDSIGIVSISHSCPGVAARACGLVSLEPTRVAEILKDRPSWFRDCRAVDVLHVMPTANGGTIELLYMQLYAPTILAPARDFWLLRYTSDFEDGSLVICEGSIKNEPSMPRVQHFMRAEMLPSGCLIRPCEGGGSIVYIVDHMNLKPWSVPEVLRPLYESSTVLAQKTTMAALRQLRQISQEVSQSNVTGWGRRAAAQRPLSQRLSRGFNEALNGFPDEGWSMIGNDGVDDVTIIVNSSPDKLMGLNLPSANGFPSASNAVLCAKATMPLQNVPPAILLRFLREHRPEWADSNMDAYSAAAIKVGPCSLQGSRVGSYGSQVILPLAHTIEHEEFLEVIKLDGVAHSPEDMIISKEMFLLQLCSGMDENAVGTCAELIFAPIDASFDENAPLLPSGFRIIPFDSGKEASGPNRTLDLASALDVGPAGNRTSNDYTGNSGCMRSVMTIAFEFAFESHMQEHVASMARQYVRGIISSIQRVALTLNVK